MTTMPKKCICLQHHLKIHMAVHKNTVNCCPANAMISKRQLLVVYAERTIVVVSALAWKCNSAIYPFRPKSLYSKKGLSTTFLHLTFLWNKQMLTRSLGKRSINWRISRKVIAPDLLEKEVRLTILRNYVLRVNTRELIKNAFTISKKLPILMWICYSNAFIFQLEEKTVALEDGVKAKEEEIGTLNESIQQLKLGYFVFLICFFVFWGFFWKKYLRSYYYQHTSIKHYLYCSHAYANTALLNAEIIRWALFWFAAFFTGECR